ncbi:MAG: NAD(P)H-hydrate dehydratase [Sphingomonas bacterium]|uniref:NAD(P)H-hydrate dehydratase n=1 Tax=Sphingomonas bacterium TaxID=1895847 RepID=UPI00260BFED7|nr:NAD(P)H-hydrate dehydratase [Sphingomonas bacterium]MDB5697184.1 NAD(P)H-hydrate dehydratase [Sphingomonas bacterium]
MIELDAVWCAANPIPLPDGDTSKDGRGRILIVGGARDVPGALLLTGEAALRVGAGKVKLATIASAAIALGVAFPEAAAVSLPEEDGDIAAAAIELLLPMLARVDAVVLGPGTGDKEATARLVRGLADTDAPEVMLVLDAAAVACAGPLDAVLERWRGRIVMTPHQGEMASLLDCDKDAVAADPERAAADVARRYGAVVALKDAETVIAAPDGTMLHYAGGGVGLGTGGSGDVLAGVVGGLLARGLPPLVAAGWGVWLHGEAGGVLAKRIGPVGFLARELLPELPGLLAR